MIITKWPSSFKMWGTKPIFMLYFTILSLWPHLESPKVAPSWNEKTQKFGITDSWHCSDEDFYFLELNLAEKQPWQKHGETFEKCISVERFLQRWCRWRALCRRRTASPWEFSVPELFTHSSVQTLQSGALQTLSSCKNLSFWGFKAKLMALHSLQSACI